MTGHYPRLQGSLSSRWDALGDSEPAAHSAAFPPLWLALPALCTCAWRGGGGAHSHTHTPPLAPGWDVALFRLPPGCCGQWSRGWSLRRHPSFFSQSPLPAAPWQDHPLPGSFSDHRACSQALPPHFYPQSRATLACIKDKIYLQLQLSVSSRLRTQVLNPAPNGGPASALD